ncbi:GNAT family N-acetyltransferase, partial [Moorena sp. SIO4A1]|uniref:GNAT family N-acetyltransferase n=1 Tax=Moorena sp. SIO4A1 TaxID=2607835 RepID=UPI0025E9B003
MTSPVSENPKNLIRPFQYHDLAAIETLVQQATDGQSKIYPSVDQQPLKHVRRWYWLLKFLSWFPNPYQYSFCIYVAEQLQKLRGLIKISPFNHTRSTWRVEQVLVDANTLRVSNTLTTRDIGSALLRHCFEKIWQARTWLLEVNINHKSSLALYRQNGFQPLAQMTYWVIEPTLLEKLAVREPDLPNLLPVSNADAQLLYQLDTASMPPIVRKVF